MSVLARLFVFAFFSINISASIAQNNVECDVEGCDEKKPTIIWMRPPELGVEGPGITITSGPVYDLMVHLSSYLESYSHQFEAYPVKRAWSLIQHEKSSQKVYCFYGASYQEERTKWGYYSEPTSINLPLLVVSRKALPPLIDDEENVGLSQSVKGLFESVSLQALLNQNLKTVLYKDVSNAYARTVEQWATKYNVLRVHSLGRDLGMHTIALLKSGRIDFGYVGPREIAAISKEELDTFHVYQVSELSEELRGTKRLLCSKTALGQEVTTSLNQALARIFANPEKSEILKNANFSADGYSHRLRPLFDERWDTFLSKK